jgi:hypothetical protein
VVEPWIPVGLTGHTVSLGLWPLRAGVDPLGEDRDLGCGEPLTVGRHHLLFVRARDPADELALGRLAGHDHGAEVAPLDRPMPHVEPQAALLRVGPVAVATPLHEERADVVLERRAGRWAGDDQASEHGGHENRRLIR